VISDSLLLILSAVMVGAVIGAWVATLRLFAARMGGARLPVWLPWVITPLFVLIGLVMVAGQIITASTSLTGSPTVERGAAAFLALLVSPVWIGSASLAALGMVLHYSLDGLLRGFRLRETSEEGLAQGIRAAWATIGLLSLFFGLQTAQSSAATQAALASQIVIQGGAGQALLSALAILLAGLTMTAPAVLEREYTLPRE